ncbi:MAG: prolyl oligopeptidase family serine peptidase [Verrucomicrobiales bacterium]|nr:prolyl oligopeptidase family serine peptidase [Verrucomicrobiales bacterium]
MKKFPSFLPIFIATAVVAHGQAPQPTVEKLSDARAEKVIFLNPEYLSFAPKTKLKEGRKIPLIIYLHGAGGSGTEIRKITGQVARGLIPGLKKFVEEPCLIVAPQCSRESSKSKEKGTWEAADLEIFLEQVQEAHPEIDLKRIYLTGNSMGGYGSWMWGGHHPENFAAIAPIVGGIGRGGPKDVTPDLEKWAANLAKVPVYAFAGGQDRVVPAERSERIVAAIKKTGGKQAKIKVFPEEGHGAGRLVFSSKEFFEWMFSQKRD